MEQKDRGQLIAVDVALQSMRDSGFDLPTAAGEVVDNSIEAKAHVIKIKTGWPQKSDKPKDMPSQIKEIAFFDDGEGIPPDILQHVLTMGYSTRYNQRATLGRFGMGLKSASISFAQRIEIYSRTKGGRLWATYIDLEEIREGTQEYIEKEPVDDYPSEHKDLALDEKGNEYPSGTLVIWKNIDRLHGQGKYASSLGNKIAELRSFLARAYRYFLEQGLEIYLDGQRIQLHDPLYLMLNPRVIKCADGEDYRAELVEFKEFPIDGHKVKCTVTLLPERFRLVQGDGGFKGSAKAFAPLHIAGSEGKISIVRNNREIYYDFIPRILPSAREQLDRFIGIEIKFPAHLDEYFAVRNVKRGAEPVEGLRNDIKEFLAKPIQTARRQIRALWGANRVKEQTERDIHRRVMDVVKEADRTAPAGRGGMDKGEKEVLRIIDNAIRDMGYDLNRDSQKIEQKKREFLEYPFTMMVPGWPGNELLDIEHYSGRAIVRLNDRHVFTREVYRLLEQIIDGKGRPEDFPDQAVLIKEALDCLFIAYAKAENLHTNPDDVYRNLRTYWGLYAGTYVSNMLGKLKSE